MSRFWEAWLNQKNVRKGISNEEPNFSVFDCNFHGPKKLEWLIARRWKETGKRKLMVLWARMQLGSLESLHSTVWRRQKRTNWNARPLLSLRFTSKRLLAIRHWKWRKQRKYYSSSAAFFSAGRRCKIIPRFAMNSQRCALLLRVYCRNLTSLGASEPKRSEEGERLGGMRRFRVGLLQIGKWLID